MWNGVILFFHCSQNSIVECDIVSCVYVMLHGMILPFTCKCLPVFLYTTYWKCSKGSICDISVTSWCAWIWINLIAEPFLIIWRVCLNCYTCDTELSKLLDLWYITNVDVSLSKPWYSMTWFSSVISYSSDNLDINTWNWYRWYLHALADLPRVVSWLMGNKLHIMPPGMWQWTSGASFTNMDWLYSQHG